MDGVRVLLRTVGPCGFNHGYILGLPRGCDTRRPPSAAPHYRLVRTDMGVPFDPDSYIDKVVRRFRLSTDGGLPPLAVRYALDQLPADASDEDLMARVQQVVNLWRRQKTGGTAGLAEVCERFLVADGDLRSQTAYQDPRWWR